MGIQIPTRQEVIDEFDNQLRLQGSGHFIGTPTYQTLLQHVLDQHAKLERGDMPLASIFGKGGQVDSALDAWAQIYRSTQRKTSAEPLPGYFWESRFGHYAEGDELFRQRILAGSPNPA